MQESPVVKLTNAILLSFLAKNADKARIWRDGHQVLVVFIVGGKAVRELEMPPALLAPVVRRLGVMASLPTYGDEECAEGRIVIRVGEDREHAFFVRVQGEGPELEAYVFNDGRES